MTTNNQDGQSTVEFILTFAFGVCLILVVFTTSVRYATGYLVHYATFMASRVYLTQDNFTGTIASPNAALGESVQNAKTAFTTYKLSAFQVPDESFEINAAGSTEPNTYLTVGGFTSFDMSIDPVGRVAGQKKLEMVSEAFLGKEPTRAECARRTCFAITGATTCSRDLDITLYDDGC